MCGRYKNIHENICNIHYGTYSFANARNITFDPTYLYFVHYPSIEASM